MVLKDSHAAATSFRLWAMIESDAQLHRLGHISLGSGMGAG